MIQPKSPRLIVLFTVLTMGLGTTYAQGSYPLLIEPEALTERILRGWQKGQPINLPAYKLSANGDTLMLLKRRVEHYHNDADLIDIVDYTYSYVNKGAYEQGQPVTLTRKQYEAILSRLATLEGQKRK